MNREAIVEQIIERLGAAEITYRDDTGEMRRPSMLAS
jgi:hypothetical protein